MTADLRVYIAAPFPERDYAIAVMRACEARGFAVASRWLKGTDELDDVHARNDLADVAAADWLVALNPPGYENKGTGGRHTELGYALALGKPVALVGERSNIFHYLSDIVRVDGADPASIAEGLCLTAASRPKKGVTP